MRLKNLGSYIAAPYAVKWYHIKPGRIGWKPAQSYFAQSAMGVL
jgi:hypothetical protein